MNYKIIEPKFENINSISKEIEHFAEPNIDPKKKRKFISEINIIIDEVLCNIIKYSDCTQIEIEYRIEDEFLVIEFKDDGHKFNPLKTQVNLDNMKKNHYNRESGGLGIFITLSFADKSEYLYENKKIFKIYKKLK